MRVEAMNVTKEIIFLMKMNHPSDGTAFRSVSTYLLNISSGWPSSKPWGVSVRTPIYLPKCTSHLTEGQMGWIFSWDSYHCHGKLLSWIFHKEGHSKHSRPTCTPYSSGCCSEYVWQFRVNISLQKLHPRNRQCYSQFEKNMCEWKRPTSQIECNLK